jgi:hypothetical protein
LRTGNILSKKTSLALDFGYTGVLVFLNRFVFKIRGLLVVKEGIRVLLSKLLLG